MFLWWVGRGGSVCVGVNGCLFGFGLFWVLCWVVVGCVLCTFLWVGLVCVFIVWRLPSELGRWFASVVLLVNNVVGFV